LPVKKLPSKVPFLCLPFFSLPSSIEESEVLPYLQRSRFYEELPFQFFGFLSLNFISTIEGVKFGKVVIEMELNSRAPSEISLSLRRAKKTHEMQVVKKQKIPSHIRIELAKPDDYLMWGSNLFATLEQEFSFPFREVKIANLTVYGIPKGE
jgi:hypothetical protein